MGRETIMHRMVAGILWIQSDIKFIIHVICIAIPIYLNFQRIYYL